MPEDAPAPVYHVPVLLAETLELLAPSPGAVMLDATLGGGGHSAALAERIAPGGNLVGLDRDPDALEAARGRLNTFSSIHTTLLRTPFAEMESVFSGLPNGENLRFDGALFDLGVSSHQLDTARGFSFRRDEPLDMRMNAQDDSLPTAAELLSSGDEAEVARILWEFGEERWSRRIAQRIAARTQSGRPIETTGELAKLIEEAIPRGAWPKDIHPATRSFQGLRIAVNGEMDQLRSGLEAAMERLRPGGRLAVISYHSLEDRIVKQMFAEWTGRTPSPSGMSPAALLVASREKPRAAALTRKPVTAGDAEIARNPRARSAKLRAVARAE